MEGGAEGGGGGAGQDVGEFAIEAAVLGVGENAAGVHRHIMHTLVEFVPDGRVCV